MSDTPREYLIIQTAFLGDLLLGLPMLKNLREADPGARITVYCRKGFAGILLYTGLVDHVIEVDKKSRRSMRDAAAQLRCAKFDAILTQHESFRSLWLTMSLKSQRKIGYRGGWLRSRVFTDLVERPMELPEALRQMALLTPLFPEIAPKISAARALQARAGGQAVAGLASVPAWASMELVRLQDARRAFDRGSLDLFSPRVREIATSFALLSDRKPIALLAPGSVWATKMWKKEGYAEAARELTTRGYRVILTGSPDEQRICKDIQKSAPGALSIAGETSLVETLEFWALADLAIVNDSGAMHMAAAAGVPTVSIFGPTVLEFGYRPWNDRARVVEVPTSELGCRPCGKHGAKKCPIGTHACMKMISTAQVMGAAAHLRPDLKSAP